jgi:predicted double-glycine peptidase
MNLWLGAGIALLCSLAGVASGWRLSRFRAPYWVIGYLIPLALILGYAVASHVPTLMFVAPFSWFMMGLKKYAAFGFIGTFLLTTPLSRVPQKRARVMIGVLMAVMVLCLSVGPFVAAILDRPQLQRMNTRLDTDGVCLQNSDYTCGPASAVTALRKLGLPAEEGRIGILSCTSFQEGTPPDLLAAALEKEYGKNGLTAKCRGFRDISELKQAGLTLAVVKYSLMVDHWVAVLEVTDSEVIVGDPSVGLMQWTHKQFAKRWRFVGVVLKRESEEAQRNL